jgi:hypothetical protein
VEPPWPVTTTMLPAPVVPAVPGVPVLPATPGLPVLAELPGLPVPVGWPLPTVPVQAADPATNNPTRILPMERVIWFCPSAGGAAKSRSEVHSPCCRHLRHRLEGPLVSPQMPRGQPTGSPRLTLPT